MNRLNCKGQLRVAIERWYALLQSSITWYLYRSKIDADNCDITFTILRKKIILSTLFHQISTDNISTLTLRRLSGFFM